MPSESGPVVKDKDELSRSDVEKQIEELKRDKMRIDEDLRRMDATEKRILEQRRRAAEAGTDKAIEDQDGEKKEETEEEKKEARQKAREEALEKRDNDGRPKLADKRSKALFGKMLGHLASAKTRLDTEKGWKSTELQQKAQERLKEKMQLSQVNIADYKKEQFDKHRQEQNARLGEIDKAIEAKELVLLQTRLEGHYGLMMNFIRTKSEPTIFYLPKKHISATEASLKETQSAIKRKIGSLKYELQPEEEDDETAARRSAAAAAAEAAEKTPPKAVKDKGSDAEDKDGSDDEEEKKSNKDDEDEPAKKKSKTDKDGSESGDEKDDKDKATDDKKGDKDGSDASDDN